MTELTVTIKGSEQTYKQKFVIYEPFTWAYDDPTVRNCIKEAEGNAKIDDIDDIKVRAVIQVK